MNSKYVGSSSGIVLYVDTYAKLHLIKFLLLPRIHTYVGMTQNFPRSYYYNLK